MTERNQWRWAEPGGEQRTVGAEELRAGLASGAIPANAPVWRKGWSTWRAASEVPELTSSILASLGDEVVQAISEPPPPPTYEPAGAQRATRGNTLRPPSGAPPPSQRPPSSTEGTAAEGEGSQGHDSERVTAPPTTQATALLEEGALRPSAPLSARPTPIANATTASPLTASSSFVSLPEVPPAPSGPMSASVPSDAAPTARIPSVASVRVTPAPAVTIEEASGSLLVPEGDDEVPRVISSRIEVSRRDLVTEDTRDSTLPAVPPPAAPPARGLGEGAAEELPRRARFGSQARVAGGAALVLALILVATALGLGRNKGQSVAPAASVQVPVAPKGPPPPWKCNAGGARVTLAPKVVAAVGVEAVPFGDVVGVSYAVGPREGRALELGPDLAIVRSVEAHAAQTIRQLIPARDGEKLVIALGDARRDNLRRTRWITLGRAIEVGVTGRTLGWSAPAEGPGSLPFNPLWELESAAPPDQVRGAVVSGSGPEADAALVYRRDGALWLGPLKGDRNPKAAGPPAPVRIPGATFGSPTIAGDGAGAIAVWADRAAANEPWGLRLVVWPKGGAPGEPKALPLPPGGPGVQGMSPSLAALPGGGYLLIWTEGPVTAHQLRAQVLTTDGVPNGEPFTLSAEGANAGQGQIALGRAGRGVAAYLVSVGSTLVEVVATSIVCSPP